MRIFVRSAHVERRRRHRPVAPRGRARHLPPSECERRSASSPPTRRSTARQPCLAVGASARAEPRRSRRAGARRRSRPRAGRCGRSRSPTPASPSTKMARPRGSPAGRGRRRSHRARRAPEVVGPLERDEQIGEERRPLAADAVDRVERGGGDRRVGGQLVLRLVDVQADPEDDGVVRGLGEDAGHLAPVDQDVVRPLDLGWSAERLLDRVRGRDAADERELGDVPLRAAA